MYKSEVCVVIPIYKEILNKFEVQSVLQCIKVLSDYSIYFVCPQGLNIDFYKENFSGIKDFTYFDNYYFKDLSGYNRLMLSVGFYKAFDKYKYMLVHQTDSYVFRDELLDWANKGFDYIGGIWFDDYHGDPILGAELWHPGNGGFSLRKIDKIINIITTSSYPLKSLKRLTEENKTNLALSIKDYLKGMFKIPYRFLSAKNSLNYYRTNFKENEDVLFMELNLKFKKLSVPSAEAAMGFSWDRLPSVLCNKLGHLPFGCHAWYREDHCYSGNKEFWSKYIDIE